MTPRPRHRRVLDLRRWFAPPPPMPGASRLLVSIGVIGQLFALMLLLTAWKDYRWPLLALGLWVALGSVIGFLALAGRVLPRPLTPLVDAVVIVVVGTVDVLVPLAVIPGPGHDPLGAPGWNWGACALVLLGLGLYRSMGEVILLGLAHAGGAVLWAAFGSSTVDPVTTTMAVSGALIPPVGAVAFLVSFQQVVARREEALATEQIMRAERAVEEAVQDDTDRRLSSLRGVALPMLRRIANGEPLPLSPAERDTARRVAEQMRHELVRGREVDWLLQTRLAPTSGPGGDLVEVRVITGRGAVGELDDEGRAAIAALVEMLRRHRGWHEMTLSLAGGGGTRPTLALVARGTAAGAAHADPGVRSAVSRLRGAAALEDTSTFVVQA